MRGYLSCTMIVLAFGVASLSIASGAHSRASLAGWEPVPAAEAKDLVGALCFYCDDTSPCDPPASCAGVTCVTQITPLGRACYTQGGTSWGCSAGGSYDTCSWDWWTSCPSSEGTASESPACGSVQTMRCDSSYGWCTGTCTVTTHASACRYDCL